MNFWALSPSHDYAIPSPINKSPPLQPLQPLQPLIPSPIGIAVSPRARKHHPNARLYIPITELTDNDISDLIIDLENESKSFIRRYIKRYFRIYEEDVLADPGYNDEESIREFERIPEVKELFNNFIMNTVDIVLRISELPPPPPPQSHLEDKIRLFRDHIEDVLEAIGEDYYQQDRINPLIIGVDIEGIIHDRNMDYMYKYNRKNRLTVPYKIKNYLPMSSRIRADRPLNRKTRRAIYKREKRELDFIKEQGQNLSNVYDGGAHLHNRTRKQNSKQNSKHKQHKHKWTLKYKRSIDCKHPKGFSQRQHCKYGRKN